ncbi:hypothetical protein BT93_L3157 [Corymbia citriodora subsp. variegata]|uniref:DUF674 domain-containing protein n=1 Tax=Corymbia citriodora subsp. variegata TaxID=360336 RepID=A0A8T0CM66_CORYI|nr:hypothetical protein BT93_L3157 [Corymbia citriodora subsp. variegata]
MATGRVNLKLLVDKSNWKVLFAEGGKDFVDFLFHILALPVGTVIRLLEKTGMVGSLGNLYSSVKKLSDVYIESSKKDILLEPKAPAFLSEIPFLLPQTSSLDSPAKTYYRCPSCLSNYVADDPSAVCPGCRGNMYQTCIFVASPASKPTAAAASAAERNINNRFLGIGSPAGKPTAAAASVAELDIKSGFVQGVVSYMVMDNLAVEPMSTISSIALLNKFDVKEIGHLEEKVVSLGIDEVSSSHSLRLGCV